MDPLMPIGLGFAARAMLSVISNEIIPATHRPGQGNLEQTKPFQGAAAVAATALNPLGDLSMLNTGL
jgi:zinc transporter ZupT